MHKAFTVATRGDGCANPLGDPTFDMPENCQHCGAVLPLAGDAFCSQCREPLDEVPDTSPTTLQSVDTRLTVESTRVDNERTDVSVEQVIRFSRVQWTWLFTPFWLVGLLCVAIYFVVWRNDPIPDVIPIAWGCSLILFVLGCIVFPYCLYLRLTPEGFSTHFMTVAHFYDWNDVCHFDVELQFIKFIPVGKNIVFEINKSSPRRNVMHSVGSKLFGYNYKFLAVFNINAYDLAFLMDDWQRRYGQPKKMSDEKAKRAVLSQHGMLE